MYSITPKLGVSLNVVTDEATHRLGAQVWDNDGKRRVYAKASGAIEDDDTVAIDPDTFVATEKSGESPGEYAAPVDMADGQYGWFLIDEV